MDAMRDAWTDARLDDLNGRIGDMSRRMDEGFNRVDSKVDAMRADLDSKFDGMRADFDSKFDAMRTDFDSRFDGMRADTDSRFDGLRAETKAEFIAVRQEIASMQRLLIQVGGGIIGTMAVGFLSLIATRF
jgi:hypothetical protein